MKKLLFILIGVAFSTNINAQNKITDAYFHELKGMEDSSGTTHLFYRMFVSKNTTCSDMDGYTSNISNIQNHVYHFDTSTLEDSVEFMAYNSISPGCFQEWNDIERFIFTDRHPDSTFAVKSTMGGLYGWFYFPINKDHQFGLNIGNPLGIIFDKESGELIITTPFRYLVIKARNDEELLKKSFKYPIEKDSVWLNYERISDLPDSLFIDFSVIGTNPYKKGHYVGIKDSNIVLSADYGSTYKPLLKTTWDEWDLNDSSFGDVYFDADSSSFYFTIGDGTFYLAENNSDNWTLKEISKNHPSFSFAIDAETSGNYYFTSNDSLFNSNEFGESTTFITTFTHTITGLYKKPKSDILFVLTREELLELDVETNSTTSLKKLPVSNEAEPVEIPKQISLNQNYPNPFNPSTVISYQLAGNSLVRLEVFDVTGRKVAVLVNGERKTAGAHQVTFEAGNLASGVYFYRLETAGQTLTQKMLLVK